MRLALGTIRATPLPPTGHHFHSLGLLKYGAASGVALLWLLASWAVGLPWLGVLAALAFYAVEGQMVFLFPVALDGSGRPFRDALALTRRAGGTVAVVVVVIPLAATMLLGGFAGRGFLRSWCLGCLAVCLWYESLRTAGPTEDRGVLFEFGSFRRLIVRREQIRLGLETPIRILYISDLHLGRWWTRGVPAQLLRAARDTSPDLILLGGDLADNRAGLPLLGECVRSLAKVAPVHAIAGNHDERPGVARVAEAVRAAGGHWLPDRSIDGPVRIDAALDPAPTDGPRMLCTHNPGVFPEAVAAGYRIVLAGHLHGGQCVLATRRGLLYPAVWFCRWHGLRFAAGGATMLVSRGVGDTFPFRFNCPREAILCEIT